MASDRHRGLVFFALSTFESSSLNLLNYVHFILSTFFITVLNLFMW